MNIVANLEQCARSLEDAELYGYLDDKADYVIVMREAAAALRLPRVEALQESVDSIHEHLLAAVRAESPVPRVDAGGPLRALIAKLESYYDFQCEGGPLRNCVEWQELKALLAAPVASEHLLWECGCGSSNSVHHERCWTCNRTRREGALPSAPVASPEEPKQP